MSTKNPVLAGLIACGTVAALVTGCNTSTPDENAEQACAAADAFAAALNDFEDTLTPESTTGEVRAAREEVQRTYQDLVRAGEAVAEDRTEELEGATRELDAAVDDVPDDATLSEAAGSLRNEAAQVDAARDNFVSERGRE